MKAIYCDRCAGRIDDGWTQPALVITEHNGMSHDVAGDYCVDCAPVVSDAIREVLDDE